MKNVDIALRKGEEMFCLLPTNKNRAVVLIGGQSGIGKTTLITNLLTCYPSIFKQPLSVTSRRPRSNEERYDFKSVAEIIELNKAGELVNLDEVYGNFYGIFKFSVEDILALEMFPIKEVHCENFYKFKEVYPNVVTVVMVDDDILKLENNTLPGREGRPQHEKVDNKIDVDIVLNISNLSPLDVMGYFIKKLDAHLSLCSCSASANVIDNINKLGYTQLAPYFYDDQRITTRNFHSASIPFWKKTLSYISAADVVVELGPGNGWLFNTFLFGGKTIIGIDIAEVMGADYFDIKICTSTRNMPLGRGSVDVVVASLADPYLYGEVFIEVERILAPRGMFAFTYPSFKWALNLTDRSDINKTTFTIENKTDIQVYSYCCSAEQISSYAKKAGLTIEFYESTCLPNQPGVLVSEAIIKAASNLGVLPSELPIVSSYILRRAL